MNKMNMVSGFAVVVFSMSTMACASSGGAGFDGASFPGTDSAAAPMSAKASGGTPECKDQGGICVVEGTADLGKRAYNWTTSEENKARAQKAGSWISEKATEGYEYVKRKVEESK